MITTTVNEVLTPTQPKYPYLGEYVGTSRRYVSENSKGLVVLFTSPKCGVVVNGSVNSPVGEYRTDWCEDDVFAKFNNEVTIKNR
jgi:hypothetical protein